MFAYYEILVTLMFVEGTKEKGWGQGMGGEFELGCSEIVKKGKVAGKGWGGEWKFGCNEIVKKFEMRLYANFMLSVSRR